MAKKLPDFGPMGLGDLTKILHNQGVSDLSWLAVSEEDYRAAEALPKQNLDIIPEFQKALLKEPKEDVPRLIPLRPHTIVNSNPLSNNYSQTALVDQTDPIRNRVAKMVMMGIPSSAIKERLSLEYSPGDIKIAAPAIREVLDERGLLGNVYVNAAHFPRACQDPNERKFARLAGKNALFVLGGCDNSNGCECRKTGICQTFGGKRVVAEVPYDPKTVAHYAPQLASEKRLDGPIPVGPINMGVPASPSELKDLLRTAFLKSPAAPRSESVRSVHTQHQATAPVVSQEQIDDFWHRRFTAPAKETPLSPAYLDYACRMMAGHSDIDILSAAIDKDLSHLVSEYGILGHSYLDMDILGGCDKTLQLMASKAKNGNPLTLDFVVRRSAVCQHCKGAPDGSCAQICNVTNIVQSKRPADRRSFLLALERATVENRLTAQEAVHAGSKVASIRNWATATAFVNLHQPPVPTGEQARPYSGINSISKTLAPIADETIRAQMDPEEVRRTIAHLMNSGLSGKLLQAAILQRYSRDDLQQVPDVGRRAALDDGVQGVFFIDPTAYRDYGKGCNDGSKHFRKRGAAHILAAAGCTGCTLQTAPGWCSKYSKSLIRHVPTQVRQAAVQARKLPVIQPSSVENPVEKYELSSELSVDPAVVRPRRPEITIGGPSLDMK